MKVFVNTITLDFANFVKTAQKYITMKCSMINLIVDLKHVPKDTLKFVRTSSTRGIVDTKSNVHTNIMNT